MQCYPRSPLLLLAFRDNHDAAVPVAPGKTINVLSLPNDDRFMIVIVDGEEFHAFTEDVRALCVAIPSKRPALALVHRSAAA